MPARRSLFEPVQIGRVKLRNRVVMAPMTRQFCPGGLPSDAVGDYYVRRAVGGVGLIITEGLEIGHPASVHHGSIPDFHAEASLAAWTDISRRVQAVGAAFRPQLWHVGGYRLIAPEVKNPDAEAVSPSGIYTPGRRHGQPASDDDIAAVIDAYARAAEAAFAMGCDGIEFHAGHGYLIDQFLWSETNDRGDSYGGDLQGRARFACEVVAECWRRTSSTFLLFFRFSQWKIQDYEARLFASPAELEQFLGLLLDAGVDVFDCSTRRFWTPEFAGSDLSLAGWTRKLSGKPTMAVGSVGLDNDVVASLHGRVDGSGVADLDVLEQMLARGDFDLVGVGRALLADPEWVHKVEFGDLDNLRGFNREQLDELV